MQNFTSEIFDMLNLLLAMHVLKEVTVLTLYTAARANVPL